MLVDRLPWMIPWPCGMTCSRMTRTTGVELSGEQELLSGSQTRIWRLYAWLWSLGNGSGDDGVEREGAEEPDRTARAE
jgi:hypothetical protein